MEPHATVLVLRDQLTRQVGPLADATPERTRVVMIEPRALLHGAPHHAQKLVATLSAMRHFAAELRGDGFDVAYLRHDADEAEDLGTALVAHVRAFGPPEITAMRPTDHGVAGPVERAVQQAGSTMRWLPNASWITDDALYDAWAEGRKTLRMEGFYREVRRATGILMEEGQPVGGRWNYDAENRQRPPPDATPPPFPSFEEDELTREVRREVEAAMPDRWGDADPFRWPVTRADALRALDGFVTERLAHFGDYQDAMVEGEPTLWHSGLSVPLNLGLLHPREVVVAALAHADEHPSEVPLNALEGFVRQIAGWREFVRHAYRTRGEELRRANALEADGPLPPAYWGAPTELRCLGATIEQLGRHGYTHHIQRLMVLGNVAQLAGTDPVQVLDWFTASHVDALDWVMVPNVMGMSQYADGGGMTSKPYVSGAAYLNRMSDHCGSCRFDPKAKSGPEACPLTSWYWSFIDRHQERFASNPRMRMIVAAWRKRDPDDRARIVGRAALDREAFRDGQL